MTLIKDQKLKVSEFEEAVNIILDKDREKRSMLEPLWAKFTEGVENVSSLIEPDNDKHTN